MFREVLINSGPRGARGTGAGFPLSVAIHALAVATAVLVSARALEEPPDPPSPEVIRIALEPPAGSAASSAGAPAPSRRTGGPAHPALRIALPPAALLPSLPSAPDDSTRSAGMPGDANGKDAGASEDGEGVPGGTGQSPSAAGGGQAPPIQIGGNVSPPRLIERVEPIYPDAARIPRIQGLVVLEAIITTDGRVEELRVLRSPSSLLSASAIDAVGRWRYLPATLNGRTVKVFLIVTADFKLH